VNYYLEGTEDLLDSSTWQALRFATALSNEQSVVDTISDSLSNRYYRVRVKQ